MATSQAGEALGTNFGSDGFPIEWQEGEKELFWIYDDLHIPNPVSPLFFDIGGWWLTCDHMFRRFGTPFACDWVAKVVNGYVYTAAVPCDPSLHAEATEYENRYVPRVPRDPEYAGQIGPYLGGVLPIYAANFMTWWQTRLRPEKLTQLLEANLEPRHQSVLGLDADCALRARKLQQRGCQAPRNGRNIFVIAADLSECLSRLAQGLDRLPVRGGRLHFERRKRRLKQGRHIGDDRELPLDRGRLARRRRSRPSLTRPPSG